MAKFEKGKSGNPGGRPKDLGDIRDIARTHTDAAIQVLIAVMGNEEAAPSARVGAATALLDRAWGRPAQTINANVKGDVEPNAGLIGYAGDLLAKIAGKSENKREAGAAAEGTASRTGNTAH